MLLCSVVLHSWVKVFSMHLWIIIFIFHWSSHVCILQIAKCFSNCRMDFNKRDFWFYWVNQTLIWAQISTAAHSSRASVVAKTGKWLVTLLEVRMSTYVLTTCPPSYVSVDVRNDDPPPLWLSVVIGDNDPPPLCLSVDVRDNNPAPSCFCVDVGDDNPPP